MSNNNTSLSIHRDSTLCLVSKHGIRCYVLLTVTLLLALIHNTVHFQRNNLNLSSITSYYYYYYYYYHYVNTTSSSLEEDFSYPNIYPTMTQDLIDFAVVGFPKCGTTFLLRGILGSSPHIYMGPKNARGDYLEMHQMAFGNLSGFLSYFPSHKSPSVKYGFKEPLSLYWEPSLYHMSTYFPKAKLIVTLRHPIPWFESLYNYRMRWDERYWSDFNITPHNRIGECSREMPPPLSKWSACKSNQPCVTYKPDFGCTDLSNFHIHLSRLGWTPRSSTRELTLLDNRLVNTFDFSQTQMFLMESNQLDSRQNETRVNALIHDLESFLESEPGSLPNAEEVSHDSMTMNHVDKSELNDDHVLKRLISICDDEHRDLRKVLLKQAKYVKIFMTFLV